jgi:hypothetical protein
VQALPHRTYVAPNYWIVDMPGLARLQAAGLLEVSGLLHQSQRVVARLA